jgi:hypothetical protein
MPDCQSAKAFVLDDSIKIRHGKKMPGVSSHFGFQDFQRLKFFV